MDCGNTGTCNKTQNKIVWVDIPVENLKRATEFYSKLLSLEFKIDIYELNERYFCNH